MESQYAHCIIQWALYKHCRDVKSGLLTCLEQLHVSNNLNVTILIDGMFTFAKPSCFSDNELLIEIVQFPQSPASTGQPSAMAMRTVTDNVQIGSRFNHIIVCNAKQRWQCNK